MTPLYQMLLLLLGNLNMLLLMFAVVLIATCFLGRSIIISKKFLFVGLGIVFLMFVIQRLEYPIFKLIHPDIYAGLVQDPTNVSLIRQFQQFEAIANTISSMVVFVYAFLFFLVSYQEKKIRRAIESILCFWLIVLYVGNVTYYEFLYLTGGKWETHLAYHQQVGQAYHDYVQVKTVVGFFIYATIVAILYFGFYRKKICYNIKLRYKILFVAWIILFLVAPELPFENEVDDLMDRYQYLCYNMGIFIPLLGIVAPIMLVTRVSAKDLKEKNEAQARYLAAELEYIERYKSAQTQTRAFRHDVVNNLTLATMLLEQGKTKEANTHLQEMLGKVQGLSPKIVTGDEMLDCIVSMKAEKMQDKGIAFSADGVVDGGLHMKPMDTCSIFANALDNAIEAASLANVPKVSMNIKRTEKFFVINIENSAPGKVELEKLFSGEGYTTKKDKEFHGFGLRNIKKTVEENEGLLQAKSGEDMFALSIMIPRMAKAS